MPFLFLMCVASTGAKSSKKGDKKESMVGAVVETDTKKQFIGLWTPVILMISKSDHVRVNSRCSVGHVFSGSIRIL